MPYNTTITAAFLIFHAIMGNYGACEDKQQVELKLSVFPETVALGDTCYALVTATNHSNEVVCVRTPGFQYESHDDMVQFDLKRHNKTWRGTFESRVHRTVNRIVYDCFFIPSGEAMVFLVTPLQFPPLEDLYQDDFWVETRKELMLIELLDLEDHQKGFSFDFGIEFMCVDGEPRVRLTQKMVVKLRNEKEMAMVDKWYHDTPGKFFPVFVDEKYLNKVPPKTFREESGKTILGYRPWTFQNIGNRYPGDPNVPTTWQGWKKLEENITPSTMRDEIHLTRIMVQYSATKRAAVLKELKDWFANMNEIQRTVMAKSLRDRAVGAYGTNLLPPFREVYKAIREYDVVPIPEGSVKHLRDIGLIE